MATVLNFDFDFSMPSFLFQIKGTEINDLLVNTSKVLDQLDNTERNDVDSKVQTIHENWNELKTIIENRVDLSTIYVRFLQLADKLTDMFTHVEEVLRTTPEDFKLTQLDLLWNKLIPVYTQLKSEGKQFKEIVQKVSADPHFLFEFSTVYCKSNVKETSRFNNKNLIKSN